MMESILLFDQFLSSTDSTIPSSCSPTEDLIFDDDNFANEIYMKFVDDSGDIDLFSEIDRNHAKMIDDDYQSINDKIDLSINDFVTPVTPSSDDDIKSTMADIKDEQQLMMEFNSILDAVSNSELSPPQTPPPEIFQMNEMLSPEYQPVNIPPGQYEYVYDYQPQVENIETSPIHEQYIYVENSPSSQTSTLYEESNQGDELVFENIISSIASDDQVAEVVEEIVLATSRSNFENDDNASQYSSLSSWSPRSEYSSNSSCSSQYGDYEPKSRKSSSGLKGVTKKRPYGRNPEEKKYRKKEQNKNAATRYRQKKKVQIEIILDEEKILADKHRKLTATYKEARREVRYLKDLLRELFKARGFIE